MFGPLDTLSPGPSRVLIAGPAGAGKTTLGRRVEAVTGLPHTEIDALFHGPGWTVRPGFAADVEAFTTENSWVTEWSYTTQLGDLLPCRADTLVWLDLSPLVHLSRLLSRTLMRRLRRIELWNGNVEPPLHTIFRDPEHIVRWGWRGRGKVRQRVIRAETEQPHLRVVRLRTPRDVEIWLHTLATAR